MTDIITTLHPENDAETNLYPNIKRENIPDGAVNASKLDSNVLSMINELHPSGVDTSTNILSKSSNEGIWVGSDNGKWYYWDGTQYVEGGNYIANVNTDMDDLVLSINDFMQSGEGVLIENNIVNGLNKFTESSITNATVTLGALYNTYKIKYPTNTAISNNVANDNLGYKVITFNVILNSSGSGKVAFRQYNSNGDQVSVGSKTVTESGEYSITTNSQCRQIRLELSFVSNTGVVNDDTLEVFNFRYYTTESIDKGINLKEKIDKINTKLSNIKILQTPILLLNFDAWDLIDSRYEILNEYGVRATVTSVSDQVDRNMLLLGFDIGAYSNHNYPYDTYGNDALSDNPSQEVQTAWNNYVYNCKVLLESRGDYNITAWFCRQNKMCVGLKNALEKYGFKVARGSYPATSSYPTKLYFDDDFSFSNATLNLTPDNYNACVNALNTAVSTGKGISIFTHKIYDTISEANANYGITEQLLRNFLDVVKNHIENNNLKVITYREMYAIYQPLEANQNDYNRLIKMINN